MRNILTLTIMFISNIHAQEILNIDNQLKAKCKVERENAITSTESDKLKFNYSESIKIGDWMFEDGHYTNATSTVLTEGFIIKSEKELKEIIDNDENFFFISTPKSFSKYKERELKYPHVMTYFITLKIEEKNIRVKVNKKVNVHNMVKGLLPPHKIGPVSKTISLNQKEVVNGISFECKSVKKLSQKERKKVMKAVKRLAKNIDDSSRYSQKDLIKKVLSSQEFNKVKKN